VLGHLTPLPVLEALFGDIDQLKVVAEGTNDGPEFVGAERCNVGLELFDKLGLWLSSVTYEALSQSLDRFKGLLSGLGSNDVSQQFAKVFHATTQLAIVVHARSYKRIGLRHI
jgi:hypothetical protein